MEVRSTPFMFRPVSYTVTESKSIGHFQPGDIILAVIYEIPTAFNGATGGIEIGTTADPDGFVVSTKAITTEQKLGGGAYHTAPFDDANGQSVAGIGFMFQVAGDVFVKYTAEASATVGYLKGTILWLHTGDRRTAA